MSENAIRARPGREAAATLLQSASLPASDLTDAHMEHFYFCGPAGNPAGLIGLEICGPDALLRSLVVAPDHRAGGIGGRLLNHAEAEARRMGIRTLYLLTTTAEAFFARRGYVAADREKAPPDIRSTREFAGLCPASSAFMLKAL
jgi:amino-acid N-acetyltransferase